MVKSQVGLPDPLWPRGVDIRAEAAKAQQRLLPVTVLYTSASLLMGILVARSGRSLAVAAGFTVAGVLFWTLLEYLVHRHVLHGPFPDGPGVVEHFLHKQFDHLHVAHHQRPWDGNHINGSTRDTLPFVLILAALAALAPIHTLPMFLVGLVQSYIIEEWIHHSVHYYTFDSRYFRYIRRHHLYHHSRHGSRLAYGLTSDVWDIACGTQPDLGRPAPLDDLPRDRVRVGRVLAETKRVECLVQDGDLGVAAASCLGRPQSRPTDVDDAASR
jgi:Fatty acid hydroxylase superfamily